jgi:4-hydroxy-tetrahydrodipicolinate synthase
MIQGIDGALVGFGTFIPGLISNLLESVKAGDLKRATEIQKIIDPLKQAVYGNGEPTGEAHARMKVAMKIAGILKNSTPRPPTTGPNAAETEQIRVAVQGAGLLDTAIPSFAHNRG